MLSSVFQTECLIWKVFFFSTFQCCLFWLFFYSPPVTVTSCVRSRGFFLMHSHHAWLASTNISPSQFYFWNSFFLIFFFFFAFIRFHLAVNLNIIFLQNVFRLRSLQKQQHWISCSWDLEQFERKDE